jgi:hypothetical protein
VCFFVRDHQHRQSKTMLVRCAAACACFSVRMLHANVGLSVLTDADNEAFNRRCGVDFGGDPLPAPLRQVAPIDMCTSAASSVDDNADLCGASPSTNGNDAKSSQCVGIERVGTNASASRSPLCPLQPLELAPSTNIEASHDPLHAREAIGAKDDAIRSEGREDALALRELLRHVLQATGIRDEEVCHLRRLLT